jgi:hypothetical protein
MVTARSTALAKPRMREVTVPAAMIIEERAVLT